MSDALRVVVVGAGIVGSAIAEALARDGAKVTVVERGSIGGGATAAGMGHIVVMDDSVPQIALTSYSQKLWDSRASSLPTSGERIVCGTLWVAEDDEEMAEVERKHAFYSHQGVASQVLTPALLYQAEPSLRPNLAGGLLVNGDSVVYPPPIAAAMLADVRKRGGEVLLGKSVTAISGHEVQLNDGSRLPCDYAIVATGTAVSELLPQFEIRPRKGHLVITDRYPGVVKHQLVELGYLKSAHSENSSSVAFNVQPRPTGQLLIGSSRQYGADSSEIEFHIVSKMLRRAMHFIPSLASMSAIRIWTGFRASTVDKLPLIGPIPDDPHLLLATGHEGLGITTSLGTAALIADHIAGRESAIPIEPYLPVRLTSGAMAHAH